MHGFMSCCMCCVGRRPDVMLTEAERIHVRKWPARADCIII